MIDMLKQFAKADINHLGDCLSGSRSCGDQIIPIWIYWIIMGLLLAVFITGLVIRIKSKHDKKMVKRADVIMAIGFIGIVIYILLAVIGWPFAVR